MAFYSIYYHLIFNLNAPFNFLFKRLQPELYAVMGSKFVEIKCHPILINGIENHCHILVSIHPSVSVSEAVQKVKLSASAFLKDKYPNCGFQGWRRGYAAFTLDKNKLHSLYKYLENQEQHHKRLNFKDELCILLRDNDVHADKDLLSEFIDGHSY